MGVLDSELDAVGDPSSELDIERVVVPPARMAHRRDPGRATGNYDLPWRRQPDQ
jgi:hypothetical protein